MQDWFTTTAFENGDYVIYQVGNFDSNRHCISEITMSFFRVLTKLFVVIEKGSPSVAQAGLEFILWPRLVYNLATILLAQVSKF